MKIYIEYYKEFLAVQRIVNLLKIDINFFNYSLNLLSEEIKEEVVKSGDLSYKYVYGILYGNKPSHCKYSAKLIPFDRVLRSCLTFSDEESIFGKGTSTRGKKRPDHAIKISKKLKGIKRTEEQRQRYEKRLQGIDFKNTFLKNKNIITDGYSDATIREAYSKYQSEDRKSFEYKKRFCLKNYIKYNIEELSEDMINNFSEKEIQALFSELMSEKSSIAMKNNPTMGNSIPHIISNIKYNRENLTEITVRSGMEKKIALLFETNKIPWSYETLKINYFYEFDRRYIIDFIFELNGIEMFFEVKGSVRNKDEQKTIAKLTEAVKQLGHIYLYQGESISSIEDLEKLKITDTKNIIIKHVYDPRK